MSFPMEPDVSIGNTNSASYPPKPPPHAIAIVSSWDIAILGDFIALARRSVSNNV